MENTKKIIQENISLFPEFGQYFNLIIHIEEMQSNDPNNCIDTCKALIEGISKTVIRKHEGVNYSEKEINKLEMMPLVRRAIDKISEQGIELEEEFIKRICSLIQLIVEKRNSHGEISHGKHSPRTYSSSIEFAKFITSLTDGIVEYFLALHFSIQYVRDISYYDDVAQEFNQFLDAKYPIPVEKIRFSRALFDQDEIAYQEQFYKFSNDA